MTKQRSYAQVLRASSIMGGAAGIKLLLNMARVKLAALIIGPLGVGLNASFTNMQGLMSAAYGLGIPGSAVREIAGKESVRDEIAISRTVIALRWTCWITGILGLTCTVFLAPIISEFTFGNRDHDFEIAMLGLSVLLMNISSGQMAILQGMRKISDMAKVNIISAIFGAFAAAVFYINLGIHGIVPTMLSLAAVQLGASWWYCRRIRFCDEILTLKEKIHRARVLARIGSVFLANSLMGNAVVYLIISMIIYQVGVKSVGIYSAAFALSGVVSNFILDAMAADYYPRLTSAMNDKISMRRMVNEQTEVGILLALPGLMATMALSPWAIKIFYTNDFLDAVNLLQWFVLGCFARLISWPLGFVSLALGKAKWFLVTEIFLNTISVTLVWAGLELFGIEGVAIGVAASCFIYILIVYLVGAKLIGFTWFSESRKIGMLGIVSLVGTLIVSRNTDLWVGTVTGVVLCIISGAIAIGGIIEKLGPENSLARLMSGIPGVDVFCWCARRLGISKIN